ncbi:MAG: hypothetical protein JWP87_2023 [Labilithrix sp.]|nr:hypothetical protein [Labilithrix sp.]
MDPLARPLPFAATTDQRVELAVVDLGVARAYWEGVPTARLLARIRLGRDERDLVDVGERESGLELASSTWDKLMARLLAESASAWGRVKSAVARHGRAASDEGPLVADDGAIAALVHVLLSAAESDGDSSPAEGAADRGAVDSSVMRACAVLDARLGIVTSDRRAAAFEACLRVATIATAVPTSASSLFDLGERAASAAPLYPWGDDEVPVAERHALLLDRPALDAPASAELAHATRMLAAHHGALVAFVASAERRSPLAVNSLPPSSWLPSDLGSPDAATRLAAALERGATTAPRTRSLILRGGDAALDAIGAEMLNVAAHPFASAVFADILGRASRERDVVRLVSYFAIAPDAATAAHALAVCTSSEVPAMLRAWLESILPTDGSHAEVSSSERLNRCVAALAPYPHLHAAVKPLLRRTSERPPAR